MHLHTNLTSQNLTFEIFCNRWRLFRVTVFFHQTPLNPSYYQHLSFIISLGKSNLETSIVHGYLLTLNCKKENLYEGRGAVMARKHKHYLISVQIQICQETLP